jgi:flagellar M-ring protein FliF
MNKLSELYKKFLEFWKSISKSRKIAYSVLFFGVFAALITIGITFGTTKYSILFTNMNSTDSGSVITQLKTDKISYKVSGTSILVPSNQVDAVRMQIMSEVTLTNGSQGFELFDKTQLGATDQEIQINYQRAMQGELERTIKAFPQIDNARVHLVIPSDTAFVQDTTPGSASVTLAMKNGQSLSPDQVKAIVALISGAVKGIPKENVQVIDDKLTLLTEGLYSSSTDTSNATTTADKQAQLKQSYEKTVSDKLTSMLETIYGKDKVKVEVNADLDFDAVQSDTTTYDPKNVVVSEHNVTSGDGTTTSANNTGSTVDNNMTNSITTGTSTGNPTSIDSTKNYDVSSTEIKTIKAPGAVKKLTTSVAIDGNIDNATKASINNLVTSAIGFDATRGDSISVEGIPFDTTLQDNAKADLAAIQKAADQAKQMALIRNIGIGVGAVALIGFIIFMLLKRKKSKEEDDILEGISPHSIDVVIDQAGNKVKATRPQMVFDPVELEAEDQKSHIENEIKKYAKDKPEQVADVVKSWLAEDER